MVEFIFNHGFIGNMYEKQKEKGDEKLMKKRMISMLLCGIMVWNFSGTAVESAGGKNFSSKGKFHGKKVEKHLRYEDLKGTSKTKIDYAKVTLTNATRK